MSDIFREVDEELRQEQAKRLWKRFGKYIIAVVVLVVAGVAGHQIWTAYDQERRSASSTAYAAALQLAADGQTAAALEAFSALTEEGAGGYAKLAAFEAARLQIEAGNPEAAVALLDGVADDSGAGRPLRDAASLLAVMQQLETGDPAALQARLEPLAQPGQAYRPLALELSALLALRNNDRAAARQYFQQVADDLTAPSGSRTRATQMLTVLGGESAE